MNISSLHKSTFFQEQKGSAYACVLKVQCSKVVSMKPTFNTPGCFLIYIKSAPVIFSLLCGSLKDTFTFHLFKRTTKTEIG